MADTTTPLDFANFVDKVKVRLTRIMRVSHQRRNDVSLDLLRDKLMTEDNVFTPENGQELATALTKLLFKDDPETAKFHLEVVTIKESAGKGQTNIVKAFKIVWEDRP